MLEGRCRAQSCRPRRLKVTAGSRGSWPQKATVSVDYAFPTIPPTTDQSVSVTSIVVLLPRPPYGNRPRSLEGYRRYGLRVASGTTNRLVFRSLVRTYPERDHRRMLLDLIETRGDKGTWLAAAKESRFFDIAIECAAAQVADPSKLVRAARDFCGKEPKFAATVALLALSSLLAGGGYDPRLSEVDDAVKHLLSASRQIGEVEWALRELGKLAERQCAAGREPFPHAVQPALSRWHPGEPNL
jgi:hypothetical protein